VVISGDTAACDCVATLAKDSDLLIHEMMKPDPGMVTGGKFSETGFDKPRADRPQTGHTAPTELGRIAAKANVRTLVATHLAPYTSVKAARDMQSPYVGDPGKRIWADMIFGIKKQFDGAVVLAEDGMVFDFVTPLPGR
jgi:ribonuclease Z